MHTGSSSLMTFALYLLDYLPFLSLARLRVFLPHALICV